MRRNLLTVKVHTNRDAIEASFPARWVICWACEGHATTTRHIECDGGGFTASEWAEACDDDPGYDGEDGFAEKYFGGFYDRPCPTCNGLGRIQEIDDEALSWRQKILLKAYRAEQRDNAEIDRIHEMERRYGA